MVKKIKQDWEKGHARPLLKMIKESLNLMDAYISSDDKCVVLVPMMDGAIRNRHQGPPSYHEVLQTYDATDEYFKHLGSFVPKVIPRQEFEKLFNQYEVMRLRCEEVHVTDRR